MVGPQDLSWPYVEVQKGGETQRLWTGPEEVSKRGILMGLPTTWFFLCLVHLFWIEMACDEIPTCRDRAVVCGDDLVAIWPQSVIDKYHGLLGACGAKISSGKHFVFTDSGVFTEKCF